jgi:prolyl-tRNA synthetase
MRLDDKVELAFGWRATDWDLQGVPVRVELGPRDLAENTALLYRRDARAKTKTGIDKVVNEVQQLTGRIQTDMFEAATARRDAAVTECTTLDQDVANSGLTVRCLHRSDGSLSEADGDGMRSPTSRAPTERAAGTSRSSNFAAQRRRHRSHERVGWRLATTPHCG